jgi:putative ABC transport system ATP-binding protein
VTKPAPAASLSGVSKTYPAAGEDVRALHDVTLEVAPGEIVALVGRSGSGKTTLLNILGTLDRPTSGSVAIAGRRVDGLDEEALLGLRRSSLGFVFQFFHLLPYLTALENAALPLWLAGKSGPEATLRARELLAAVGLDGKADRPAGRLSGGEMQRVAVARALAGSPALVLADEPTGNLDQANAEGVLDLLRALVREQGAALVVATHSDAAARVADRRVHLLDGRVEGID